MLKTSFTIDERNKVYCLAMTDYESLVSKERQNGICFSMLNILAFLYPIECSDENHFIMNDLLLFPEIYKHKPKNLNEFQTYWFYTRTEEGIAKRLAIFEQAIEETDPVDVIFRKSKATKDIYALFPYIEHNDELCMSYEHVGQHSGANYEHCIKYSVPAKPEEYFDLFKELETIGYNLNVRKRK